MASAAGAQLYIEDALEKEEEDEEEELSNGASAITPFPIVYVREDKWKGTWEPLRFSSNSSKLEMPLPVFRGFGKSRHSRLVKLSTRPCLIATGVTLHDVVSCSSYQECTLQGSITPGGSAFKGVIKVPPLAIEDFINMGKSQKIADVLDGSTTDERRVGCPIALNNYVPSIKYSIEGQYALDKEGASNPRDLFGEPGDAIGRWQAQAEAAFIALIGYVFSPHACFILHPSSFMLTLTMSQFKRACIPVRAFVAVGACAERP
jgi:hypothetical protein